MKTRADLMTIEGFDTLETDTEGNPCVWENYYSCRECSIGQVDWSSYWSCRCDDLCPACGKAGEPILSEWIGPKDTTLIALWEALPEAGSDEVSPLEWRARRPSLTIQEIATLLVELGPEDSPNPLYQKFKDLLLEELDPDRRAIVDAYRNAVSPDDGVLEVDSDAEVSIGDDPGAYVMTWTWVEAEEAGIPSQTLDTEEV